MVERTYHPLYTTKKLDENIWVVDGETISFLSIKFPTRMVIIRLKSGELFIHSPINLTEELKKEIDALGRVKYLISPNKIHFWYIDEWQKTYPQALTYISDFSRALKKKPDLKYDKKLEDKAESKWDNEIDQCILKGSLYMEEVVFFHKSSKTLIVTDCIENFSPNKITFPMKIVAKITGILAPNGSMPRDQRLLIKKHKLKPAIDKMISWQPDIIIPAHGDYIKQTHYLQKIFAWVYK